MGTFATLVPDVLIHVDDVQAEGGSGRALRDACRRGHLVRVRRGTYCTRDIWDSLDGRQRHILAIRAVLRRTTGPVLVAGRSAAALRNLPYAAQEDDDVTLLVPFADGGSSEPGVRRTCASYRTASRDRLDGIPVTDLPRTVLDVARALPFSRAVAVVDAARSRRNPSAVELDILREELDRASFARGATALARVLDFSTSLSDSVGESEARAEIHRAGFEVPELQRRWRDAEGWIVTDFYWGSADAAGEFDGKVKYTREEFTHGDPSAVVWREKRREDRLRRQVRTVVRLVTDTVRDRVALTTLLLEAGIPRRRPRAR